VQIYETDSSVKQYLAFHYETEADVRANSAAADMILGSGGFNFPARVAEKCSAALAKHADTSVPHTVLDIGCSVGRSSFELSKSFDAVTGIDYSHAFVGAAQHLQNAGGLPYSMQLEGNIFTQHVAKVPTGSNPARCTFEQGDACALRDDLGSFGCVLGANLICRLPDPLAFINRTASLVAPGGVLVLTTPWYVSWLCLSRAGKCALEEG
jgi:2-polyprenyl-3-methyl-5-hydroxy-6-metoxy-1,4-benzoquinol methylase